MKRPISTIAAATPCRKPLKAPPKRSWADKKKIKLKRSATMSAPPQLTTIPSRTDSGRSDATRVDPRTGQSRRTDASKGLTVFVLIVVTLYFGREVLVPITLALLLTFLLAAPVNWFRRFYLGRVPSVVLVVTLALGALIGIGSIIGGQLRELASDIPGYATTIEGKMATIKAEALGRFSHITAPTAPPKTPGPSPATPAGAHQGVKPPAAGAAPQPSAPLGVPASAMPSPLELVAQYVSPLMSPLATIGIVFVVAVFALLQREDLRDRLIRLIGPDDIHRTTLAMDDAGRRLTRYFLTQLAVNAVFGVVVGIGLAIIGVPRPILWGVLATILRFIPYVGSFISAILPIALAAAVKPGWSTALWTIAFYVGAEGVTGQLIEPLIYGQSSGLSPFSVIVSAIFWSWVWGPVGLFLSTPLTLCLAVMGRHVKGLEFLDVLLGDRPPLTPTESFYQRILADDADEVLEQAELMLKDMPLARYYDEVALPGMQLAARDAELGILTVEQQENIRTTINELVAGLSEQLDRKRPRAEPADDSEVDADGSALRPDIAAWQHPAEILSIAGRGPLDEPAASMLVHLLEQSGIGSRMVKYRDVSRYSVETLNASNVAMVCIAYLNINGSPAHLRYLVQRLRKHLRPGTPVLVGLWSPEDSTIRAEEARVAIGAEFFTSSFEEVLKCCEAIAVKASGKVEPAFLAAEP
jgi:predicted PurR-regulated permease PerM